MSTIPLETLVERLTGAPGRDDRLTHLEVLPPRAGTTVPWPAWVHPSVVEAWQRCGVPMPWAHQAEAATLAHDGNHTVISTGTASGKSLGYLLPGLTEIVDRRGPKGQPLTPHRSKFVFTTKDGQEVEMLPSRPEEAARAAAPSTLTARTR